MQYVLADCSPVQQIRGEGAYTWGSVPTTYDTAYGYTPQMQLPVGSTRIVLYPTMTLPHPVNIYSATDRYIATLLSEGYIEFVYCSGRQKLHLIAPEMSNKKQGIQYQEKDLELVPNATQFYALSSQDGQFSISKQKPEIAVNRLAEYRRIRHTLERFTQGICQANLQDSLEILSDERKSLAVIVDSQKPVVAGTICRGVEASAKHFDLVVDVEFGFDQYDKSAMSPLSKIRLSRIMQLIEAGARLERVEIIGFTDAIGPTQYNKTLSLKRAQTMRDQLVLLGVDSVIINIDGRGSANHVSGLCQTKDRVHCYAEDRRVEIRFIGQI